MPDEHIFRELERVTKELDRLRDDVRNPQPPYVTQALYEEARARTGERIGNIEKDVAEIRAALSKATWLGVSALVMGIFVPIVLAILLTQLGIK